MGLFIELQHELDKLAIYLQLATKTPAALAGSYNADMRFKQIFDLLSNCRVFMYRLGKFYAKSWGNGQQVEQVLRTIIFSIGSINRAAQGIQVKALVLDGAEMYEYKQQLKELNKHYGSSRLTVFDVLGCAVLFLITAVMIRFLFFAGDIDEQPKVAVTPTTALGYSVLTAVMVWLIQGVARWKIRPKVENNFGVRLREFVGETLGILEELTKPILEEVTYGTFPGNG